MELRHDAGTAVGAFYAMAGRGDLWPSFRPMEIPLLLHGAEGAFLVGHPAPPKGYRPVGEVAGRLVFGGERQPEMAANTAAVIEGEWTALAELPAQPITSPERFARLLLHEAFHVHQQRDLTAVAQPEMAVMALYPEADPGNNAMAIVENQELIAALRQEEGAVERFLAMRQHRQRRLERGGLGSVPAYEQAVEYMEGTATYVECRAGHPVDDLLAELAEANLGGKGAAYRRFYWTGAAQALVLDQRLPGWRERLRDGQTLQMLLLASASSLPPVSQVVKSSGFVAILEREEQHELRRRERVAALMEQLVAGPGVRVEVILPPSAQGILWDPATLLVVEPGKRLHTRFCGAAGPGDLKVEVETLCLEEAGPEGRRLSLRLAEAPRTEAGDRFRLRAPGLVIDAPSGEMESDREGLRVRLGVGEWHR